MTSARKTASLRRSFLTLIVNLGKKWVYNSAALLYNGATKLDHLKEGIV